MVAAALSGPDQRRTRSTGATLLAVLIWLAPIVFVAVPIASFFFFSFWSKVDNQFVPDLTFDNYVRWWSDPIYLRVFFITVQIAVGVAILDLLVGYPAAYLVTRARGSLRGVLLALLVAPLFMSYIIKLYALRSLLGGNGYLKRMGDAIGLDLPISALLFSQEAVFFTMVLVYLPFVVLPIYASLINVPKSLVHASADLGGRPGQTFWRVIFPLSLPGTAIGGMFVFVLALGDFVTPQMMGGTRGFTYGKLVWSQFGLAYEWTFGAAMAASILFVSLAVVALATWITRRAGVSL
ncbi:MAG: ABC transporter permease [Hyphomicrobiales bacterium]|nr:ABC transporter permease [Hyphomicrobiales bacterium]